MGTALDERWADAVAWIMLLASPLFILFGARLFRWMLVVLGFLVSSLGVQLALQRLDLWHDMAPTPAALVLTLTGLLGAWALSSLWTAGMFVLGGTAAVLLVNALHQFIAERAGSGGETGTALRWAILSGVFLAGGLLSAKTWKSVLRVLTAFVGSYMAIAAIDHIGGPHGFGWWSTDSLCPLHGFFQYPQEFSCRSAECYTLLVLWAVLFAIGAAVQTKQKSGEPASVNDSYDEFEGSADGGETIGDATQLHAEPCATHDVHPGVSTAEYLRAHAHGGHLRGQSHTHNHAHGVTVQTERDPLIYGLSPAARR